MTATGWDAFTRRTYGPGWEATKRRYFRRSWRRHCFWCLRRGRLTRSGLVAGLELNHLTYARGARPRWWQTKAMCHRCHRVETWLTRRVRPGMARHRQRWAHGYVTWAGWLVTRAILVGSFVFVWFELRATFEAMIGR